MGSLQYMYTVHTYMYIIIYIHIHTHKVYECMSNVSTDNQIPLSFHIIPYDVFYLNPSPILTQSRHDTLRGWHGLTFSTLKNDPKGTVNNSLND